LAAAAAGGAGVAAAGVPEPAPRPFLSAQQLAFWETFGFLHLRGAMAAEVGAA
jgi:hypothetical protein